MSGEEGRITDEMLAAAAVGWRLAHDEACRLGPFCSAHQPIGAAAQRPRLVSALVEHLIGPLNCPANHGAQCCGYPEICRAALTTAEDSP